MSKDPERICVVCKKAYQFRLCLCGPSGPSKPTSFPACFRRPAVVCPSDPKTIPKQAARRTFTYRFDTLSISLTHGLLDPTGRFPSAPRSDSSVFDSTLRDLPLAREATDPTSERTARSPPPSPRSFPNRFPLYFL